MRMPGTTNRKNGEQLPVRALVDRPDLRYELRRARELDRDRRRAAAPSQDRRSHGRQRREPGQSVPGVRGADTPARRRSTSTACWPRWSISAPAAAATPTTRCCAAPPPCSRAAKSREAMVARGLDGTAGCRRALRPRARPGARAAHHRGDVPELDEQASGDWRGRRRIP